MMKVLAPKETTARRNLIRQGLYWEALDLPRDCNMKDVVLRIAELRRSADRDQEFSTMLVQVKNDFATGNYPAARELCDDFFTRIGDDFVYQKYQMLVGDNEVIKREDVWAEFRGHLPYGDCRRLIKSSLTPRMRSLAVDIINEAQEKLQKHEIDADTALKAASKSIKALEVARHFSDKPGEIEAEISKVQDIYDTLKLAKVEEIKQQLDRFEIDLETALTDVGNIFQDRRRGKTDLAAEEKRVSGLLCRNYGVSLINKAQEAAKTNPNFALGEARKGLGAIERAKGYGHDPGNIDSILGQGKKITAALEKAQQLEGLQQIRARTNRCVSQINEVLENETKKDVPTEEAIAKVEGILQEMKETLPQVSDELVPSEPGLRGFFWRRQHKQVISNDRKQLESLIQGAHQVLAKLYLARGVRRINEGQEKAHRFLSSDFADGQPIDFESLWRQLFRNEHLVEKDSPPSPAPNEGAPHPAGYHYLVSRIELPRPYKEFLLAVSEIRGAVNDLKKALEHRPEDSHVREQLKIAESVLAGLQARVLEKTAIGGMRGRHGLHDDGEELQTLLGGKYGKYRR